MTVAAKELLSRYEAVRDQIRAAAERSSRSLDEISLVAVSKTHSADRVRQALNCGLIDFGENRVQAAEGKILNVGRNAARWHLIGHLQANKARRAVGLFDVIHSLDSISLANRLERACVEEGREELPVLIQVDLAGESTKSGLAPAALPDLVKVVNDSSRLKLVGLMVLPPFFEDSEQVRPFFRKLREMRDELQEQRHFGEGPGELSMGMTHDFEIAIEEGATILRIGTAIFGEREAVLAEV